MGYNIIANNGKINYGIKHFAVDTINDLLKLPPTSQPGSTAYCLANGKKYMLDREKYWCEMPNTGGNSGGSSGSDDDIIDTVYDGGTIGGGTDIQPSGDDLTWDSGDITHDHVPTDNS